jgi:hypothetical protein
MAEDGKPWQQILDEMGEHNPNAEWDACVLQKDEHWCYRRHPHHTRDHECSCGFSWPHSADDDW